MRCIARDFLIDTHARGGNAALLAAWRMLILDLIASVCAEWWFEIVTTFSGRRGRGIPLVGAACALIVVSNFSFGNDLAGTVNWASALAGVAFVLGLSLRSASASLVAVLLFTDTAAGTASVFVTHHNLATVFDATVRWIPLACLMIAAATYGGAAARRYC
ncbi:MAG: hypothetical protein M3N13_04490 [Candidatus Eremiobacteraeota bacterium]|nr:hypothetical protein [Candidatus Eremiobacteraeota bacterium]